MLPSLIDDFNFTWFVHMGFLARNIFYVSDEIKVFDFETLKKSRSITAMKQFYDVIVEGEVSPYQVRGICLNNNSEPYLSIAFCDFL